jgi:parvulin-like peptidyl-prolyl isomerase
MPYFIQPPMTDLLHLGNHAIAAEEIVPLLIRYQLLPQFKREWTIDRAIAEIACTPADIQQSQRAFFQQQRIASEADLQAWMAHYGVAPAQLEAILTRQAQLEIFKRRTWEDQLPTQFLQRRAQFDQVIYSLLRVQDVGAAQEFYFRLKAGEQSFAELARDYSQGPEAQNGGCVGPVELSSLHPTLAKLLATSPPGKLWPPARLGEWVVIVRLEQHRPAELNDEIRQRLLHQLLNEWVQEQWQQMDSVGAEIPKLAVGCASC